MGRGGMGDVYRCQDRQTQSVAAVKVIRRVHDHSRFQREAAILSVLSHEAIVRYLDHGRTDTGTMFIAMEWLEGHDLAWTLDHTTLSIADCVMVAQRVCAGLSVAHRHGFVHRDIKPSNIFLCGGKAACAKLLDFGVAHRGVTTLTATRAGTLLGTVGYMAPEQASGATLPDPRDDLFSLGCVLFECISGRPAFLGENAVRVLESVLHTQPPDVRLLRPETPDTLAEVVQHMLRKSRGDRPADAEAVLRSLQEIPNGPSLLLSTEPANTSFGIMVCARGVSADSAEHVFAGVEIYVRDDVLMLVLRSNAQLGLVDIATQALHGARALRERTPHASIWVAAIGHNIEGASIEELTAPVLESSANVTTATDGFVAFDAITSALLRVSEHASNALPHADVLFTPALQPAAIATVPRQAELSVIEAVFEECKADEVARSILVTAPSGFGKSQLCGELLGRIRGSERIEVFIATLLPADQAQSCALLRAIRVPDAAVADPANSGFDAALARLESGALSALVLCIDDAQWADLESMRAVAGYFARMRERPLLLIGFARPGMSSALRELWNTTDTHPVTLRPLAARAAERCLQHTALSPTERSDVVSLAGGNPRLLVAIAAMGGDSTSPDFVVASLLIAEQLLLLSSSTRKVLCALSMFTGRLRSTAVHALLDTELDISQAIRTLCEDKLLIAQSSVDATHQGVYVFSHPLIQSAAYRCMSNTQRVTMRRLAAEWLACWGPVDMQLYADA
ncbi:MAG TPA: protein kinase [Polyangiales bacterium]|nr:protein kinase [Polyangiales bacterium]